MLPVATNTSHEVRFVRTADIQELIRLRSYLLSSGKGFYASQSHDEDARWKKEFETWALPQINDTTSVAMAVIDSPTPLHLSCCGIGIIDARPPGPGIMNGKVGWIQSIVTDPQSRRQGLAGGIITFLMAWFSRSDVHRIMLNTTPDAADLYRGFGFAPCGEDALVWNDHQERHQNNEYFWGT